MDWKKVSGGGLLFIGVVLLLSSLGNQGRVLSLSDTSMTVEERVISLEQRVSDLEKRLKQTTATSGKTTTSSKSVSYLRLLDGKASGGDWRGIVGSEFWLDLSLYGSSVGVTWEGWLLIQDGNGTAYARLYDITNNRAVDASEVLVTSKERASFFSKELAIWRGQNQYRVEVKSSTGYPVTISEARLKISVK